MMAWHTDNKALLVRFLVLLGLLLPAACDQPAAQPQAEIRPVRSQVAKSETLTDLPSQVGEVRPHYETDLGFKIGGKILTRPVDLGTQVKKGDIIARLDEQDQRNQLAAAQADLVSAQAMLRQTTAEEQRQAKLHQDGWTTQATYDGVLQARDAARAAVHAAEARLRLAEDQQSYAVLRASEDGAVTALGAQAGQVVAAGQLVARLARLDQKDAVFTLAESTLLNAPHDPEVDVHLLDAPSVTAHGRVTEVSPSADPVTRTYLVKVALPDAPPNMRLGMTVIGQIHAGQQRIIPLPAAALFQQDGLPAVWVVDPATGQVGLVKIGLLRIETDRILVASGLADGAVVVTAGVQRLRPGQTVRLAEATLPANSGATP